MRPGIAHGGRLIEARRRYPQAPAPFIDLSTGINPCSYPVGTLPPELLGRLPEPETLHRLQQAAACAYGADDPSMVVAAPGTQILISLLPYLLALPRATILGPTYGEHGAAWMAAGATVTIARGFEAFRSVAVRAAGAAILCNPNNPDGKLADRASLLELAGTLARQGGVLLVDEAFADLETPDPGLARFLPHPGLLILRSFGKSYGLAGLRLGFLLGDPEAVARIRLALGPWAVSGPALMAGCAGLSDRAWRDRMRVHLQEACERMDQLLGGAGFSLVGGTRLFRLFRGAQAQMAFETLAQAGILVRRFDHDPELLRLGLPASEPEWARLGAALCIQLSQS